MTRFVVELVAWVVAGLAGLTCRRDQPAPPPPPPFQLAADDLIIANTATIETGPLVSGTLEAAHSATIGAQLGGTIKEFGPELGQAVSANVLLAQIEDPGLDDHRSIVGPVVGQRALGPARPLAIGQAVRFAVHGYPDQAFTGTISRIAPSADPTTKQIAILVDLLNPSRRLLAGLFAHGRIAARTATGVVVPISAVDARNHPPAVLRVAGTTVERVPVQLGLRDPLRDEAVVTGIAAGDRILARAIAAPPPGARVVLPPPS